MAFANRRTKTSCPSVFHCYFVSPSWTLILLSKTFRNKAASTNSSKFTRQLPYASKKLIAPWKERIQMLSPFRTLESPSLPTPTNVSIPITNGQILCTHNFLYDAWARLRCAIEPPSSFSEC